MTYDYGAPPDPESVVVAWLSGIGAAATERLADDALPFYLVTSVAGTDDQVWIYATVDVDTFAADRNAANIAAWTAHRRLISLRPNDRITLADGSAAYVDRVRTEMIPTYFEWAVNTVERYVARYLIDLRFDREGGS